MDSAQSRRVAVDRTGLPVAVLVVDDQLAVREGLVRLISCASIALRAIASAGSRSEALHVAAELRPDVVLLDADLAGEDGLALIPLLGPSSAVIVVTCHGDPATRVRAQQLGAMAFIEKHLPAAELLRAVDAVLTLRIGGEEAPRPEGSNAPHQTIESSDAPPRAIP